MMNSFAARKGCRAWLKNGVMLLLVFVLACASLPSARASEGEVIRVGYSDSDGIVMDRNRTHSGYAVDYLNEIAKLTGWKYEFYYDSWTGCMDALERGEVDLLVQTLYLPERAERFLYSRLDMATSYTILCADAKSDIYYRDYAAMEGCCIGVAAGTYYHSSLQEHLEKLGVECKIIPFTTETAAEEALERGEVHLLATGAFSHHPYLKMVDRFAMAPAYFVANKDDHLLMEQLDAAMEEVRLAQPDLHTRLSEAYSDFEHVDVNLTREEREYIDALDTVNIRMFAHSAPLFYYVGDSVSGILPDYLDEIGNLTGLKFRYIHTESDSALEEAALLDDGSLMLTANTAVSTETDLIQSDSLMRLQICYVKRLDGTGIFEPSTVALPKNMVFLQNLLQDRYTLVLFDTVEECMEAVILGEADMTAQFEFVITHMLQKPRYAAKLMHWLSTGYTVDLYLYGEKEYQPLFDIIDKVQLNLSAGGQSNLVGNAMLGHSYTKGAGDILFQYNWMILMGIILLLALILWYLKRRGAAAEQKNRELQRRLMTDELTGLYNREGFLHYARQMIDRLDGDALIIRINIQRFKQLNERYGMEVGDSALLALAERLKERSASHQLVAGRFSSDHFYLCVAAEDMEWLELPRQSELRELGLAVKLSYGVYPAWHEKDGEIHLMCDRADMANAAGLGSDEQYVYYFSDAEHQRMRYEQMIEESAEQAIREEQFVIYIQPKYDIGTEALVGGEVLVRWIHPEQGFILPGKFIELFERNGFIRELDYFVWEKCCAYLAQLKRSGAPTLPLSANMSQIHIYSSDSTERLKELLQRYELESGDLEIEITESMCAENPDLLIEKCRELREMGVRVAMDDFGSGYSSLSALKTLPIDVLKMDLRFLADDDESDQTDRGHSILRSTIEMAHMIGLDVVVEGLETAEQRDFLREIGKCAAQGYYYAKPMPAEAFTELLKSSKIEQHSAEFGMAANLRRERLRREQLRPLLEQVAASKKIFGYTLPEGEGVMSPTVAERMNAPTRIADFAQFAIDSGIVAEESVPKWKELIAAAHRGEPSGEAVLECYLFREKPVMYWIRFDTLVDHEGNPLMAIFSMSNFEKISAQVKALLTERARDGGEDHGVKE